MIKRLFLISGLLLLTLILVLVAIVMFVDPNEHRERISDLARDATGRELHIVDDMKLSVFPWIGVEFGAVTLGNAEGFGPEPFAKISGARVKVRLIPLFSRRIEVDTVTLHGLEVRLARAADGRTNWDDLTADGADETQQTPPSSPTDAAFALPAMLTISGLDIRQAAIFWRDEAEEMSFELTGFNLESGRIEANKPVDLTVDFNFSASEPALAGHIDLATRVTAAFADDFYSLDNLRLRTRLNGDLLPVSPLETGFQGNIAVDLKRETLEIPAFTLATLGLDIRGSMRGQEIVDQPRIAGRLDIADIQPRALLQALGQDAPETADRSVLGSAALTLAFDAGPEHLNLGEIQLRFDDSTLAGSASVRNFAAPAIGFDLRLDRIDADRYLPPEEEVVATPATAPAAAIELPLETLRELDLDGRLAIDRLKLSGLTMSELNLRALAKNGIVTVSPVTANLYGGRYSGNIRMDVRGEAPQFSLDESLTGVQAGPLLKDMLDLDLVSGLANFRLNVSTRGAAEDELVRNLNGNAEFSFRDGAIKGMNAAQLIREAQARLQGRTPPAAITRDTDFTELAGSLKIANGVARNEDLRGNSPYLRLSGSGQVDLVNERIDYRLRTRVVDTATGQGGAGLDDVKGVDIPIRVTGALMAPDIRVDADFLRNLLRDRLAPQVEQLRQEVDVRKEELKQEADQKAEEKKQELRQELQDKVDQQLKRLLR